MICEVSVQKLENFLYKTAKFCEISVQNLENFLFKRAKFCLAKNLLMSYEFFIVVGRWQHLKKMLLCKISLFSIEIILKKVHDF